MRKTFQQFLLAATLLLLSSQMQAQFVIGKDTLGGKVAFIDASGEHGLIAAKTDLPQNNWVNAINACKNLQVDGFMGWRLPANQTEITYLYVNRTIIGGFTSGTYWTSFQANINSSFVLIFDGSDTGAWRTSGKTTNIQNVRPVRSF
jgi:hypothetical protein